MTRHERHHQLPDWHATAFSRIFWAFPFLALTVGLDKWAQDFPDQALSPLLRACIEDGNHHARQGRFERADEQFQRVADVLERLSRDFPSLRSKFQYQLGMIHFDRCYARLLAGRLADAQAELDKARARWKEEARVFQKQKKQYVQELQAHPDEAYRFNNLAWFLVTCPPEFRDAAEAIVVAKRALQREPSAAYLWTTLGLAHYRAGEFPAAALALHKAVALQAENSQALFFLAMTHWQLGHKADARQCYDKAVTQLEAKVGNIDDLRPFRVEAALLLGVSAAPARDGKGK